MSGRILKRDRAKVAIIEIADYLASESVLVSTRFLDEVEKTLGFLATFPEIAGKWESDHPRLQEIRVWQVSEFPNHLLFYRPIDQGIELIYVCHASRDLDHLLSGL